MCEREVENMHINWEAVSLVLAVLVPVIGKIFHMLGKQISPTWAKVLTALDPEDADSVVSIALDARKRKTWARKEIRGVLNKYNIVHEDGLAFDDVDIDTIIAAASRAGKAGITYASTRLKKK
jgi:hypothetical protein